MNIQNEIDHRIKNNLNVVTSILGLQILDLQNGKDDQSKELLRKSKLRIEAMAMAHDPIYKSKDLVNVDFKKYINDLCLQVNETYQGNMRVKISTDNLSLPLEQTLQLGIIINELVTNTIKHALPQKQRENTVYIELKKEPNQCILTYIEKSQKRIDIQRIRDKKSLGWKLIELTLKQMQATLDIRENDGFIVEVRFGYEGKNENETLMKLFTYTIIKI